MIFKEIVQRTQTENGYVYKIASPGVIRENVKITYDSRLLSVSIKDSFWGDFTETYIISKPFKDVTAKVENGVLTINLLNEDVKKVTVE